MHMCTHTHTHTHITNFILLSKPSLYICNILLSFTTLVLNMWVVGVHYCQLYSKKYGEEFCTINYLKNYVMFMYSCN
jgi:hypothetical protein